MFWIAIAACIAALGAVLFGVFRAEGANNSLGLDQIKKWRKDWVPITILVDEEDFLPEEVPRLHAAVKAGARFWNEQVGIKLFVAPTEASEGAIVPVMRHDPLTMGDREHAAAYASLHLRNGELHRAAIYMVGWENHRGLMLARILKHELGHCLGLAHDEIEYSVMYSSLSQRVYCVSPPDKEFLLEVYS